MSDALRWISVPGCVPGVLSQLPNRLHAVEVRGKKLLLARGVDEVWRAFPQKCPHSGGPLVTGNVENGAVICPWHRFAFDLTTGACRNAGYGLQMYAVKVAEEQVWVGFPKKRWGLF